LLTVYLALLVQAKKFESVFEKSLTGHFLGAKCSKIQCLCGRSITFLYFKHPLRPLRASTAFPGRKLPSSEAALAGRCFAEAIGSF
jgi:hypothetical protein